MEGFLKEMAPYIIGVLSSLAVFLKSRADIGNAREQHKESRRDLTERQASMEARVQNLEKRLDDSFDKFDRLDVRLDELTKSIAELSGIIKTMFSQR